MNNKNIDPNQFKGKLPSHIRQGIPPYLQILFSARAKLPFLRPIQKPQNMNFKGLNEGINYQKIKDKLQSFRDVEKLSKQKKPMKMSYKEKRGKWRLFMENNLQKQRNDYSVWFKERKIKKDNKSSDPFNTLIVYKLVRLKELSSR